jgi:hypothetical protein
MSFYSGYHGVLFFTLPKFQKEYDKGADKSGDQHTLGTGILS